MLRFLAPVMMTLAVTACGHETRHESEPMTTGELAAIRQAKAVAQEFENGNGRDQVGLAVDAILATSERAMRERGLEEAADDIAHDRADAKIRFFGDLAPLDLGDHDPLSQWLAAEYKKILGVLGDQLCEMLHISDLNVINYGVPVVFHPKTSEKWCSENETKNPDDSCEAEYRRHFAGTKWQKASDPFAEIPLHEGLAPVVAYWIVWGACEAATWGGGWFVICTPTADLVEIAMERWVAPPVSDKIFAKANQ